MLRNLSIDILRSISLVWACLKLVAGLVLSRWGHAGPPEVLFRHTLQDLGMTYLKLGQFLALRIDLLPRELCVELGKLFENVAPMDPADVHFMVEREMRIPLEELFLAFDWTPIAAASVAQVHEARTTSGERVAVKVQRRDLEVYFGADMRNLRRLAALIDALHLLGAIRVRAVAEEFAEFTRRELDFLAEAQADDRMRQAAVSGEIIPRVLWALTTRRLLTMEFIEGVSLAKAKALMDTGKMSELARLLPGLDLRESMRQLARASLHQLLVTGFFHADLHPGNVLLCPGNRVALLDAGIFGAVNREQQELLANHMEQIALGNINQSFRHYAKMFHPTERTDYDAFQRDAKEVLYRWFQASRNPDLAIEQRMVAKFSDEMFAVVRRHHLSMAMQPLLFWRALVILDATVLQMCPDFDLLQELRGFFVKNRPGLTDRIRELSHDQVTLDVLQLGSKLPTNLRELLYYVSSGRFALSLATTESRVMRQQANRRLEAIAIALFGVSVAMLKRAAAGEPLRIGISVAAVCLLVVPLFRLKHS